jgi:hypothetical protein
VIQIDKARDIQFRDISSGKRWWALKRNYEPSV